MKNDLFTIEVKSENGGLSSLVLNDDPAKMNWFEGLNTWGIPVGFQFVSMTFEDNVIRSRYQKETLELEVIRTLYPNHLTEKFVYRNNGYYDYFFKRGDLGIYTTFNDSYVASNICIDRRCHAHIWCGGGHSYVHARKMGPFPSDLALVLTQGALDCYSVERIEEESSNDRGDFVLHPSPCHLLPGAEMVLEWSIIIFPHDHLQEAILAQNNGLWVDFAQETVFPGETFDITVTSEHFDDIISVNCNGCPIPYQLFGNRLTVSYLPRTLGEHKFEFQIGQKHFWVLGYSCLSFDELLEKRVRFILKNQQMLDPRSPLYGAFLIYDNEEHSTYYNYVWRDHNTSGERGNMGLLICRWAQLHPEDSEAIRAVDLYEQYLLRETYEVETGIVHGDIGKHSNRVRLYNTAGLINFWQELYRLKKDIKYLHWIDRSIRLFYSAGGFNFYPNGTLFSDAVDMLKEAGMTKEADEVTALVRKHVTQILDTGLNYPPHEVRFEQTIATPAVAIPAAFYDLIDADTQILERLKPQMDLLCRFSGNQPDYHLNEIPIRHWDEYWFGKKRLFGDTFPHYLSQLTARAFVLYGKITNDLSYRKKAAKCLRNCLCLFSPDGTASCAYLYPFSVTMRHRDGAVACHAQRGEFFDPFANDQDGVLYMILRLGGNDALN